MHCQIRFRSFNRNNADVRSCNASTPGPLFSLEPKPHRPPSNRVLHCFRFAEADIHDQTFFHGVHCFPGPEQEGCLSIDLGSESGPGSPPGNVPVGRNTGSTPSSALSGADGCHAEIRGSSLTSKCRNSPYNDIQFPSTQLSFLHFPFKPDLHQPSTPTATES